MPIRYWSQSRSWQYWKCYKLFWYKKEIVTFVSASQYKTLEKLITELKKQLDNQFPIKIEKLEINKIEIAKNIMQKKSAYRYKSYIAIGSNIGNWKSNFNLALKLMNKFGHVEKVSRVYFTKPFGITNQKYFHNAAFLFTTNLYFNELFIKMCFVEKQIKKNKISN